MANDIAFTTGSTIFQDWRVYLTVRIVELSIKRLHWGGKQADVVKPLARQVIILGEKGDEIPKQLIKDLITIMLWNPSCIFSEVIKVKHSISGNSTACLLCLISKRQKPQCTFRLRVWFFWLSWDFTAIVFSLFQCTLFPFIWPQIFVASEVRETIEAFKRIYNKADWKL